MSLRDEQEEIRRMGYLDPDRTARALDLLAIVEVEIEESSLKESTQERLKDIDKALRLINIGRSTPETKSGYYLRKAGELENLAWNKIAELYEFSCAQRPGQKTEFPEPVKDEVEAHRARLISGMRAGHVLGESFSSDKNTTLWAALQAVHQLFHEDDFFFERMEESFDGSVSGRPLAVWDEDGNRVYRLPAWHRSVMAPIEAALNSHNTASRVSIWLAHGLSKASKGRLEILRTILRGVIDNTTRQMLSGAIAERSEPKQQQELPTQSGL